MGTGKQTSKLGLDWADVKTGANKTNKPTGLSVPSPRKHQWWHDGGGHQLQSIEGRIGNVMEEAIDKVWPLTGRKTAKKWGNRCRGRWSHQ